MNNIPSHIGIIMDGNGRWAKIRNKPRSYGHKIGSDNVDRIVSYAFQKGIKVLSLYAFSCENWQRPKDEVNELMHLLESYFRKFIDKVVKNDVRLSVMGDISVLSPKLKKVIFEGIDKSKNNSSHVLNIGINYGGRQEIVKAVNELVKEKKEITENSISEHLYTFDLGEPDLIIRTGGEIRLSNFMLFQCAYSELYFTDVLWPDFDENEFEKSLLEFSNRNRRFGRV